MHFYAWKKGLKTGMYYLRTRPAADAIKFTVKQVKQKEKQFQIVFVSSWLRLSGITRLCRSFAHQDPR